MAALWKIKYHPLAVKELEQLDGSVRKIVLKGILKVSSNPKPQSQGGEQFDRPYENKVSRHRNQSCLQIDGRQKNSRNVHTRDFGKSGQ